MRRVRRLYRKLWLKIVKVLANKERGQDRLSMIIVGILCLFCWLSVEFYKAGREYEHKLWYSSPLGHAKKFYQDRWEFYMQARSVRGPHGDVILLEPIEEYIKIFIEDLGNGSVEDE